MMEHLLAYARAERLGRFDGLVLAENTDMLSISLAANHHLPAVILGGIDGCMTIIAVIASVAGAGLPGIVAFVLGAANMVTDGFSMVVSNYQAVKSEGDARDRLRARKNSISISCPRVSLLAQFNSLLLLTHEDLRRTARIRAFLDFLAEALAAEAPLLEGRRAGGAAGARRDSTRA